MRTRPEGKRRQRDRNKTYAASFSAIPSIERLHPSLALLGHGFCGACGETSVFQPHDIFLGRGGLDSGGVAYMFLGGMVSEGRVDLLRNLRSQISSTHPPSRHGSRSARGVGEYSSALFS